MEDSQASGGRACLSRNLPEMESSMSAVSNAPLTPLRFLERSAEVYPEGGASL